jgi:hypothetical protein
VAAVVAAKIIKEVMADLPLEVTEVTAYLGSILFITAVEAEGQHMPPGPVLLLAQEV